MNLTLFYRSSDRLISGRWLPALLTLSWALLVSGCRKEPTFEQLSTQTLQSDLQSLAGDVQAIKSEQELLFEQLEAHEKRGEKSARGESGVQQQLLTLSSKCANSDAQVRALHHQLQALQTEQEAKIQQLRADLLQLKAGVETLANALSSPQLPASSADGVYTVQSGDTLERIARRARVSVESLKKRNNLSSDHIIAGQKLQLP